MSDTEQKIKLVCEDLVEMLCQKNRAYGNSALDPVRIFSDASTEEQLLVRMDDKLSRIRNQGGIADDEDPVKDLTGYLILYLVKRMG